ncbi:LysR family transcriptional regulator [Paraburkholderia sp. MMS20-SJTR3]|uniref:LysR family transcriptional regulator n=1 Tax=Paraburkholderia sejongensis TaxID=2886946 RepID=A0ABS8JQS4_9BURK|nr:LysR family transcriptional regulator [Paraburkholderia sp. MMS20-SJTR3]MCC8392241.1 LysR family transcriptional regulator [Paraburkholderia sp. MMS20-SJTR3]
MDKLVALKTLLEVADAEGFAKAAKRMGVATSSVARLMDALEADLGTALLTRTSRRVSLTDAGANYVERIAAVLDGLAEADESILDSGTVPVGTLRLTVPATYNRVVLAPHLAAFMREQPNVALDVVVADQMVDLALDRIDVAIRIGVPADNPQLVAKVLAENPRLVVASPDYLQRHGAPAAPADLADHQCLRIAYGGSYRARQAWTFTHAGEQERVNVRGRLVTNSLDMLLSAVLAAQGIALLPRWLVEPHLRTGQLSALFADQRVTPHDDAAVVFAAFLPNRRQSLKVRAFLQFIETRLQ